MIKKVGGILLSVLLGLVFIYSGYTKLLPVIETFEFTFVEIGIANWYLAPLMARVTIALEFFTGVLLISCFRLRNFTLPLTIGLLIFFTFYLVAQILISGNTGNCGCFGEHLHMTPLEGVIKNIVLLLVAVGTYLLLHGWDTKFRALYLSIVAVVSVTIPFVINPVDYSYTSNNLDEEVNYALGIDKLYGGADTGKVQQPTVDLRQGKHVVAFLSLTCGHCRIAAKKAKLIKRKNPSLPIYFVLNGERSNLQEFLEETGANNIPFSFCLGKTFVQLAGTQLPRIYYLDNGIVVKKVDYYELSQYDIEDWLQQ